MTMIFYFLQKSNKGAPGIYNGLNGCIAYCATAESVTKLDLCHE